MDVFVGDVERISVPPGPKASPKFQSQETQEDYIYYNLFGLLTQA